MQLPHHPQPIMGHLSMTPKKRNRAGSKAPPTVPAFAPGKVTFPEDFYPGDDFFEDKYDVPVDDCDDFTRTYDSGFDHSQRGLWGICQHWPPRIFASMTNGNITSRP